jgi:hypothetical protein
MPDMEAIPHAPSNDGRTAKIAALNDALRRTRRGGHLMATSGVLALGGPVELDEIFATVGAFDDFSKDNDPHGERDFGAFEYGGKRLFWKIDYYDRDLIYGSPDPADPTVTARVLTVMLAEDY